MAIIYLLTNTVNRDGANKRIPTNQLQQFLEDGWLMGMFMHNKS